MLFAWLFSDQLNYEAQKQPKNIFGDTSSFTTPWIKSAEYESTNLLTFIVSTSSFDFERFVKNNVTGVGGSLLSVKSSSTVGNQLRGGS